jgi:hypothetical protein
MPHRSLNAQQMRPNPAKKTPLTQAVPVGSASAASPPHPTAVGVSRKLAQRKSSQRKLPNWMTDWRFFTIVGLSVTGGVTALSIAFLFKMPALPNCPAVFWPLASASLRLHCAQLAANKETVPDLLEAITLLHTLGKDHPLYPEASRLIEDWSAQILDLAEADFQAGKLEDAIAAARKIPPDTAAAKLVDNQVGRWQTIWSKAAGIYNQAGEVLKKANLQQAQEQAARLLSIDNEYWRTTKYAELNNLIIATRKDITRLGKAERALRSGVVDDIVASLQEIAGILKESFVYKDAQELIPKLGRKLLDLAESALERRDYNTALDIANRIPGNIRLDQEVDDFRMIAQAQSRAWNGGVLNLEDAIADAQRIQAGRPLYDKAQRLIERWQVEIRETAALDQAKQLAQAGDLQNAIAQAAALSPSNQSAQAFLRETRGQAQVQVDRPILDQAEQMAIYGDAKSLEAAIAQAQQIGRGRSLYAEAQERIQLWSKQLRGLRDQAAAQEVGVTDRPQSEGVDANGVPGITEFNNGSAAAPVATQRSERSMLQRARSLASSGAPDDLMQAIGMAQGVPDASPVRADAVAAIDQWSQQMVQSARSQAAFDVSSAIAIVQRVPPGTSGYADAQALLKQWQRSIDQ